MVSNFSTPCWSMIPPGASQLNKLANTHTSKKVAGHTLVVVWDQPTRTDTIKQPTIRVQSLEGIMIGEEIRNKSLYENQVTGFSLPWIGIGSRMV